MLFRKAGFTHVSASTAHTVDAEADMGALVWLRYTVWDNCVREIKILRELLALLTCKVAGWV
jgi:hypothetical protein